MNCDRPRQNHWELAYSAGDFRTNPRIRDGRTLNLPHVVGKLNDFTIVIKTNGNGVLGSVKNSSKRSIDESSERIIDYRHHASPHAIVELLRPRERRPVRRA